MLAPFCRSCSLKGPVASPQKGAKWAKKVGKNYRVGIRNDHNFQLSSHGFVRCLTIKKEHNWGQLVRLQGSARDLAGLSRRQTGQTKNTYFRKWEKPAEAVEEP